MNKRNIDIINVIPLRGPNIWTYRPVIEAWLDIGELEDAPSNTIPGFYERLTAWLPGLMEHHCGVGERGGFLQRLREGTWAGHVMEHVMIELQNLAGMQTGFGQTRSTSTRGVYKMAVRARHEQVSRTALQSARDLVMAAIDDTPFDVDAAVAALRDMVDSLCLGPSTACIVDAATDRRIPSIRLNDGNLVQLGYGACQRRIWTAETDRTPAIAESISSDKDLTKRLLASCGVPVPEGRMVNSPEDAWDAAEDIGLPVVVKPSDGNHGRGVSTDLRVRAEIEAAYHLADAEGSDVLVERFIPGDEHRLLVVGGEVVAAAKGELATVTGDGVSTIVQLIDSQINTDPRRGTTEDFPLNVIRLEDDPAVVLELGRQGLTGDAVPEKGRTVLIQRNGNVAFDVTDRVHPEVAALVSLAARIVGLDIAGVDLVARDISRPLDEQQGAIVEINAGPGLLMHLKPASGEPRPVGRAIVNHLFDASESGRIPVVGVGGSRGKTMVARLVGRLMNLHGLYAGVACSDGLYFNERLIDRNDCANWESGHRVLINRAVEGGVFENGPRSILAEGLAYDRCLVGVVTNIDTAELLPEFHVDDLERLIKVMRTQVDVVLPEGAAVLNAADPNVVALAPLCDGEVVYFAMDPELPVLAAQREQGGRAVYVRGEQVVLSVGAEESAICELADIPLAASNVWPDRLENILAAVGAAWAAGVPPDLIRTGLETFDDDFAPATAR
ncbi:cyanophycin synthetase [Noviherbaspirillum galbum]|uniref:Cyanophycin synthetase n=1 Tax=Noviherbaspirillum galbum TaxID=2709383 RepID=A0A6B3SGC6_9BURK|nr:cyanophycin synthetase [Noviherbaspirillum galbum]NEX59680.1 cyanophycin synthetase [Noviherbaspirillum galbum]